MSSSSSEHIPNHHHSAPRVVQRIRSLSSVLTCFKIFLVLVVIDVAVLLSLGFRSEDSSIDQWTRSLEHFVMAYDGNALGRMKDQLLTHEAHEKLDQRQTEEAGDDHFGILETDLRSQRSLDNYYSRSHITSTKGTLVIGGTDGSGTRAFVDVLTQLGVPMLIDDGRTMDIHAEVMFGGQGWPPMAKAVLQAVHSANYDLDSLPDSVQDASIRELTKLHDKLQIRHANLIKRSGRNESSAILAKYVTYGYKAPVTMLLLPILSKFRRPLKYLHIVRDGRDIAMSSNQSPVKKFYLDMYPNATETRDANETSNSLSATTMAIRLWNDWNSQLLEWQRSHADGTNLDFLVLRTEDLLHPERKFESLVQLADFVGSPMTLEELCCMSRRAVVDLGHSPMREEQTFSAEQLSAYREKRDAERSIRAGQGGDFARMSHKERVAALREKQAARQNNTLVNNDRLGDTHQHHHREDLDHTTERDSRYHDLAYRRDSRRGVVSSHMMRRTNEDTGGHRRLGIGRDGASLQLKSQARDSDLQEEDTVSPRKGPIHDQQNQLEPEVPIQHVQARYGKWAAALRDLPGLSEQLHRIGKEGLALFGYEPHARFMDCRPDVGLQCDATVVCEVGVASNTSE